MKRITIGLLLSFTAGSGLCLAADGSGTGTGTPAEQVQAAVKRLAEAPGYSWVITVTSGVENRFAPGPVEGQTEKGGATRWVLSFGDHKPEAFIQGDHVAVKSGDTWVKPEAITPPPPPGPPPPGPPPAGSPPLSAAPRGDERGPGHVSSPPGKGGPEGGGKPRGDKSPGPGGRPGSEREKEDRRTSFLARRLQEMKTPAAFAAELTRKISTYTCTASGGGDSFTGELPADTVQELLHFGHRPRGRGERDPIRDRDKDKDTEKEKDRDKEKDRSHGHGPPEPANAKGTVTFTIKDGALARMELHLTATLCFKDSQTALDRTTLFEIKTAADGASAKLDIPAAAKSILEAPAP